MKIEDRAAAKQLLKEATEALKTADKNREGPLDKTLERLSQLSFALRRELADGEPVAVIEPEEPEHDEEAPPTIESLANESHPKPLVEEPQPAAPRRLWNRDL